MGAVNGEGIEENKNISESEWYFCVHAKLLQLCLTLCDPMDHSPSDSSPHGISRQEYWSGLPGPPPGDLGTCENHQNPSVF